MQFEHVHVNAWRWLLWATMLNGWNSQPEKLVTHDQEVLDHGPRREREREGLQRIRQYSHAIVEDGLLISWARRSALLNRIAGVDIPDA